MSTTCSVIITHLNCPSMLDGVISHAKAYRNPEIEYELIVADQSRPDVYEMIRSKYAGDKEVRVLRYPKVDAGWPIDCAVKDAQGEYCCTLDIDAFPIHPKWLLIPIRLIKEFGVDMVGHRTGLDLAYKHKGVFFEINNYFRVCKTSLLRELSSQVGFLRHGARGQAGFIPKNTEYESCNEAPDVNNLGNWSDTGVIANWYMDRKCLGTKLSLCCNKILGMCDQYGGAYGMVLDDLVFHLVLGYADEYMTSDQMKKLGENFLNVKKLVNEGPTVEVIRTLVNATKQHSVARAMTKIVNNKVEFAWSTDEINAFIDEQKKTT